MYLNAFWHTTKKDIRIRRRHSYVSNSGAAGRCLQHLRERIVTDRRWLQVYVQGASDWQSSNSVDMMSDT